MRTPSRELINEVFPGVPVVAELEDHGTLLSIDKARRVLGYELHLARAVLSPGQARAARARICSATMSASFVQTCIRVRDVDASVQFYGRLGFEHRGRLNFESAYNIYLGGLPGAGDVLELTVNVGRDEPYDLGDGYNHMALIVDDLDVLLEQLAAAGVQPERPPYAPGGRDEYRICFVSDRDGYRIELIDTAFPTPQDPPHPSEQA